MPCELCVNFSYSYALSARVQDSVANYRSFSELSALVKDHGIDSTEWCQFASDTFGPLLSDYSSSLPNMSLAPPVAKMRPRIPGHRARYLVSRSLDSWVAWSQAYP